MSRTAGGSTPPERTDLAPLQQSQPGGQSYSIDGRNVTWQRWHFRVDYAFISPAESLDGKDVVAWYTASFSHHPHPEEFPTMSNERIRFRLAPHGFFDRYQALDVPDRREG